MERYLRSKSVHTLLIELKCDGIVSKRTVRPDGTVRGGVPFMRGALYWLLSNRIYIGQTVHKDKAYPGEHEAIVSQELFDAVQAKLAERTNPKSPNASRKVVSLLAGMIHDSTGRPMSPSHSYNHGRRYRYYVSNLNDNRDAAALRLPAGELDAAVRKELANFLSSTDLTRELVPHTSTSALATFVQYCCRLSRTITAASVPELRAMLQSLDYAIRADPFSITASFASSALLRGAGIEHDNGERIEFTIPAHQASFGHELRLRLDPQSGVPNPTDQRLIEVVARSFAARDRLLAMSEAEAAATPITQLRHLQRVSRPSYLDPIVVRSILDGAQPSHLSARNL